MLRTTRWTLVSPARGTPEEDAAAAAAASKKAAEPFSPEQQEKVNSLIAESKRKFVADLEAMKAEKNTSEARKTELEKQIEALKNTYLTKEEQAKEAYDRTQAELKANLEGKSKEADTWRSRYTTTVTETELLQAAIKHEAFNPAVVARLLSSQTKMVEVIGDDGKPTGQFEIKVSMTKVKDGKTINLELTPTDAVKLMTEMPAEYGSLFKSTATSGRGEGNFKAGSKESLIDLATSDPKAFRQQYQKSRFPQKA